MSFKALLIILFLDKNIRETPTKSVSAQLKEKLNELSNTATN